jgi:predicted nucleic acid-binding protein
MTSVFVDSNVVIYSLDQDSPAKRLAAQGWLNRLAASETMILSIQVTNEAYSALTLRLGLHPVADGVRTSLDILSRWVTAPLDMNIVRSAWGLQDRFQVRIWDALLLASANAAGCTYFLSEDLNDGQAYGSVRAINPFRHAPEDVLGRALP